MFSRIGGRGPWWLKTIRWILFLFAAGFIGAVVFLLSAYMLIDLPEPNTDFKTQTTTVYYSDGQTVIGNFYNQDRVIVDGDQISPNMRNAVIAAEDRSFYTNSGVSVKGIIRALRNNTSSGEITGGGSTITQQYVKILYLNQEQTYTRKFKEAVLSVKVDRQMSKDEILTGYLNTIYYGNGSYGVEVAAKNYFGVTANDLTIPQAAYLAAAVNSPSYYDPYTDPDTASERIRPRYQYVLDGMLASGSITQAEHDEYYGVFDTPVSQNGFFIAKQTLDSYGGPNGHILALVQQQMGDLQFSDYEINGGGLKIVTTIDKPMQDAAVNAVETTGPQASGYTEVNSALVSVEPGTGAVRAMYGGPDYLKSQLNWATLGTQPGSTFKAFAVIAALENGYGLNSTFNGNSPIYVGGVPIENQGDSGGASMGTVTLKYATEDSINTAFVDLTGKMGDGNYRTGAEKILDSAVEAGIPEDVVSQIDPVAITSLGYYPIAPIDMANAYATLLNGGERADWYLVESVAGPGGSNLYKHAVQTKRTISADVAADTISALEAVTQSGGTGTRGRTVCPTAGKTGTATATDAGSTDQHVSSSWFMGLTPHMATAVMNNRGDGNDALDGYLDTFYGGRYPAEEFADYADQWLDPNACGTFPSAANIKPSTGAVKASEVPTTAPTTAPTTDAPTTDAPTTDPTPTSPTQTPSHPTPPPTVPGGAGLGGVSLGGVTITGIGGP